MKIKIITHAIILAMSLAGISGEHLPVQHGPGHLAHQHHVPERENDDYHKISKDRKRSKKKKER